MTSKIKRTQKYLLVSSVVLGSILLGSQKIANADTVTVKSGDTVSQLAQSHQTTIDDIRKENNLADVNLIYQGQTLQVNSSSSETNQSPVNSVIVQSGDTLFKIGLAHNLSLSEIESYNTQLNNPNMLTVGQTIYLKTQGVTVTQTPSKQTDTAQAAQSDKTPALKKIESVPANQTSQATGSVTGVALSYQGVPYVWGGTSPQGFDCSGFTEFVFGKSGIHIPRTSQEQSLIGQRKPVSQAQVGDLLFWGNPGQAYHVAIYLGGNKFISATQPGDTVRVQSFYSGWMPTFASSVR